jgi:hypothetical protein
MVEYGIGYEHGNNQEEQGRANKLFASCSSLTWHIFDTKDEGNTILRNVGEFLPYYMTSYPRKYHSS